MSEATTRRPRRKQLERALDAAGVDVEALIAEYVAGEVALAAARLERVRERAESARARRLAHVRAPEGVDRGRARRRDDVETIAPGPATERRRLRAPVDVAAEILTTAEIEAARWFVQSFEGMRRVSVSPLAMEGGRGAAGERLALTPREQESTRAFRFAWERTPPLIRSVLWVFVLEQAMPGAERPWTLAEFGRRFGNCRDDRRARGIAEGALRVGCAHLADLAAAYGRERRRLARAADGERRVRA